MSPSINILSIHASLILSALIGAQNPTRACEHPEVLEGAHASAGVPAPSLTLDELISELETQERRFINVRMSAAMVADSKESPEAAWKRTGEVEVTGWFADRPGGRVRFDFARELVPWIGGPAPFNEDTYVTTYDGRVGMIMRTRTGPPDRRFDIKRAAILPERPNGSSVGAIACGWRSSMLGYFDERGRCFSDVLRENRALVTLEQPTAGARLVDVVLESKHSVPVQMKWTLDRDHGCALLAFRHEQSGEVRGTMHVTELMESDGLFFPRQAEWLTWAGKTCDRQVITVSEVKANDPGLDAGMFRLEFPAGTSIDDTASQVILHVGPSPTALSEALAGEATALTRSLSESLAGGATVVTGGAKLMTRSALGQLWSILMAVSGLGLLAVFVARGVAAGKAVRAGATTLVAIALAAPCASAQQRSLAANELGRQRVFNCGLNACAVTLHAMEQAVDLEVLAGSLGCGNHWENAASLQAMQHLLESRGLQVTALKDLKIDQVPDLLDGQHVVILHCQHSTQGGHYLVIGGRQSDKVFVVDPGTYADWLALEQFTTHIGQAASGFALVVGKRSVNAPVVHTLDEELIEVDLGDVTAVDGMVSADIAVTNPKEAAIEIMSVQSSCSCFQHAEFLVGKQRLEAGAHDTLRLTFKKSKLALGVNRQEVLLGCLLPNRHDIMLRVKAEVRAGQPTRRALAMPAQIDLGIMMSGSAKPDKQPLSLLLPMGVSVKQVSVDSTYVHCRSIAATVDEGTPYRQPSRTEDYEVEIQMPDSGDLRAEIVFQLTDDQLKSISVPVRVQRDRQEKQR